VTACQRLAERERRPSKPAERLLDGEVYHDHSKMIMKDALVGGAWAWHQDYGYWYQNGVLQPLLTSAFLAVDPCARQNVLPACAPRLAPLRGAWTMCSPATRPAPTASASRNCSGGYRWSTWRWRRGTPCFFHCNLLHRSRPESLRDAALGDDLAATTRRATTHTWSPHHPRYTPLAVVADAAIRAVGVKRFADDASDVAWLEDRSDESARGLARPQSD